MLARGLSDRGHRPNPCRSGLRVLHAVDCPRLEEALTEPCDCHAPAYHDENGVCVLAGCPGKCRPKAT